MICAFRVDASLEIGTGHVMRCLTLARTLREMGADCHFIMRELPGHLTDHVANEGFELTLLPVPGGSVPVGPPVHAAWAGVSYAQDAQETRDALGSVFPNWLILDHYAFDSRWQNVMRHSVENIMVIDDLADRPHNCDVLLDQNLGRTSEDYDKLLSENTTRLIGPDYALLRPEFAELRAESLSRREAPVLKNILITLGGVDKDNLTEDVLNALDKCELPKGLGLTVVMGPHAPYLKRVKARALQMQCQTDVRVNVSDMARLMVECDLAIGAAGSTSWERCCLGVPTILFVIADNQIEISHALQNFNAVKIICPIEDLNKKFMQIFNYNTSLHAILAQSKAASSIVDGLGVSRVTYHMRGIKA